MLARHQIAFLALISALACTSDLATPEDEPRAPVDDDGDDEREPVAVKADAAPSKPMDGGASITLDADLVVSTESDAAAEPDVRVTLDASFDAEVEDAGAQDARVEETDIEFQSCINELKQGCTDDDREVGCASVKTPLIPLSGGGRWGGTLLQGGPYGALVEWNRGAKFANPTNALESSCGTLAQAFGEPDAVTEDLLALGAVRLDLYTVFRPACMKKGDVYPVITWGNGTCGQTNGYSALLSTLASHGYVVIAANSRFTDTSSKVMLRAVDFAEAANADETSSLYKRLDLSKIGAMGHSQGANATSKASSDPRIKSLILWNGGGNNAKPFLLVTGERDIGNPSLAGVSARVASSTQPGAWLYFHKVLQTGGNATGHLTLMEQPERVTDVAIAWWDHMLKRSPAAERVFLGADCGLCDRKDEFDYGQSDLK